MTRLRLFANLRELAGTAQVDLEGSTVGAVVDEAARRYGAEFRAALDHSRIWLNGEPADREAAVGTGDEVALIPPVSGGAGILTDTPLSNATVVAVAAILLAVVNVVGSSAWFAAALVGLVAAWAVDLVRETSAGGLRLQLAPVLAGVAAGVVGSVGMAATGATFTGYGLVMVSSVAASLAWAIIVPEARQLTVLGATLTVGLVAALGTASLVLARVGPGGARLVGIFLVQVAVAGVASWAATRVAIPFVDPYVAGAVGAVVAGVIAAVLWDQPEVVVFLLEGAFVALALIAGRGFGAVCRTGELYLVDRPPGILSELDGPLMAAAVFLPILRLVS